MWINDNDRAKMNNYNNINSSWNEIKSKIKRKTLLCSSYSIPFEVINGSLKWLNEMKNGQKKKRGKNRKKDIKTEARNGNFDWIITSKLYSFSHSIKMIHGSIECTREIFIFRPHIAAVSKVVKTEPYGHINGLWHPKTKIPKIIFTVD